MPRDNSRRAPAPLPVAPPAPFPLEAATAPAADRASAPDRGEKFGWPFYGYDHPGVE